MVTRRRYSALALASLLLMSGCTTHADRLRAVRTAFYDGDLRTAEATLARELKKRQGDADVLSLEQAMVLLADGRPAETEQALRPVRDRFDYLEQKSAAEATLALLTDDQRRAYAGEDYEKVLIRAFLALANLMHGGEDAEAYSLQVIDKQTQVIQAAVEPDGKNPKAKYQQVALAPYLRAMLREETHRDFDDVRRYREMVVGWQPNFPTGQEDLQRALTGGHSVPGHGVLYVFTLVGRGPFKEQVREEPTSAAMLLADRILSMVGKQTLPPTVAAIKVPRVRQTANVVQSIGVDVDGQPHGATATITDISRMAVDQYEAVFPQVLARAVARRALKKGAVYGAKEVAGMNRGSLESLALDLAGVAWEATESADTRCWGLLPDRIQVLRVELPTGVHEIALRPLDLGLHPVGVPAARRVTIADGRNTYLLATFPNTRLVGQILASPE
jgi:hypothetical protein